jgi:AcrR family transcriptional regulator
VQDNIRTYSNNTKLVGRWRNHIAGRAVALFVKKGFEKASIREIADACGMTVGNLYRYIGTKEDVLYLVVAKALKKNSSTLKPITDNLGKISARELLSEAMEAYFNGIDEMQDYCLFVYQETKNLSATAKVSIFKLHTDFVKQFEAILEKGCESGEFKITNCAAMAQNIVTLGELWAVKRWYFREVFDQQSFVNQQIEFILKGIKKDV